MKYTHAQLLDLTGMTIDRLRHWRKEISGLNERAGRKGELTFEEIALLAVLSRATDELGLSAGVVAANYEELLHAFQENPAIGDSDTVLWLGADTATVASIKSPPELEVVTMIRIAPIIERLVEAVRRPKASQLNLFFDPGTDASGKSRAVAEDPKRKAPVG